MHKAIKYSFIFLTLVVITTSAMGDAFDQTVNQIKTLETDLEKNQIDINEKVTFIEEELNTEFANHPLKAPKGEFESDADYAARLRQLNGIIAQRRTEIEEEHLSPLQVRRLEIQTEKSRLHRRIFFTNDITVTLGTYNANAEIFPVTFEANNQSFRANLHVNKNDAPDLKNNWDQVVKTAYISIDPGYRRALVKLKIEYPSLWKQGVTWNFHEVYYLGDTNNGIAFSPDGKYLATGSTNEYGMAFIWKMENGKIFRKIYHGDWVNAVTFSPDGKYFVTAGQGDIGFTTYGKAIVWEMFKGREVRTLHHAYWIYAVVFSPNSKYLATISKKNWSNNAWTYLWRLEDTRERVVWTRSHIPGVSRYRYRSEHQSRLTFSPDGTYLTEIWGNTFSNSVSGVMLLQASNGSTARHIDPDNGVYAAAFSPNGKYLATGNDGFITFYEMSSGKSIGQIELHNLCSHFQSRR